MPFRYSRQLVGRKRNPNSNRHLGFLLAFVAGSMNAGGYLAVKRYTSHMTGTVSSMADDLALGHTALVLNGFGVFLSFLSGSIITTLMVHYARRRTMHSVYALPLLLEAGLLLIFGLVGPQLTKIDGLFVSLTVMLLSFIMGLQNALITKLSNSVIRTTHVTGIVTDIGIELGKLIYWNQASLGREREVRANRTKLRVHATLLVCFFCGGITGALSFNHVGYIATVPLALGLVALAIAPAADDASLFIRWRLRNKKNDAQ